MLKQRILTVIILVPLLVAALFYLPSSWISFLFAVFIAVAAWEWAALSGLRQFQAKAVYVVCLLLFGILGLNAIAYQRDLIVAFLAAAVLWWLWACIELFSRPDAARGMFVTLPGRIAGGFLALSPLWITSVYLLVSDNERPRILLFLFVLVWVADTAAYFVGSVIGRTRLAPRISPGKTVEGVVGGVLAVVLLAWLCGTMIWKLEGSLLAMWMGLAALTAFFSVVGDLTESKLKRIAGVKDSGKLFPGHGGVLDRIDALTAAAPVFALGAILLLKY